MGIKRRSSGLQHYVCLVVAFLVALVSSQENGGEDIKLLLVGNSYIIQNEMDSMIRAMLNEYYTQNVAVVGHLERGGQMEQHVEDFDTVLTEQNYWTWVVLQEQSQIPALWDCCAGNFRPSSIAFQNLDEQIQQYNTNTDETSSIADTVLFMTWGRRDGDAGNRNEFPDFPTMNDLLLGGYLLYRDGLTSRERPVRVAPVGLAFAMIYQETLDELILQNGGSDEGVDPTAAGTDFHSLYDEDGSHPSVHGSYLGASVLYAVLTGADPQDLEYRPAALTEERANYLQTIANLTVDAYQAEHEQPPNMINVQTDPVDSTTVIRAATCPDECSGGRLVCTRRGRREVCMPISSPLGANDVCGACPTPEPTTSPTTPGEVQPPPPPPPEDAPAEQPVSDETLTNTEDSSVATDDSPDAQAAPGTETTDEAPTEPAEPAEPTEPAEPAAPTEPAEPTEPTEPPTSGVKGVGISFLWLLFVSLGSLLFHSMIISC